MNITLIVGELPRIKKLLKYSIVDPDNHSESGQLRIRNKIWSKKGKNYVGPETGSPNTDPDTDPKPTEK